MAVRVRPPRGPQRHNASLEFWNNTLDNSNLGFFVSPYNILDSHCNSCVIVGGAVHHVNIRGTGIGITGDDNFIGYVDFSQICYLGLGPSGHRMRFVNLNFSTMIQCNATHPDFIYPQGLNHAWVSNNLVESSYGIGTATSTDNKAMHVQNQTTVPWNDNIWRLNSPTTWGSGSTAYMTPTGRSIAYASTTTRM